MAAVTLDPNTVEVVIPRLNLTEPQKRTLAQFVSADWDSLCRVDYMAVDNGTSDGGLGQLPKVEVTSTVPNNPPIPGIVRQLTTHEVPMFPAGNVSVRCDSSQLSDEIMADDTLKQAAGLLNLHIQNIKTLDPATRPRQIES